MERGILPLCPCAKAMLPTALLTLLVANVFLRLYMS